MGTRSLTVITDGDCNQEIAVMYKQFDGYPTGHGDELAKFLQGFMVVNGIPCGAPERMANGASCLAAQIIAHFKDGAGSIYLYPAGTRDCGDEYVYEVKTMVGASIHLTVTSGVGVIFDDVIEHWDADYAEQTENKLYEEQNA